VKRLFDPAVIIGTAVSVALAVGVLFIPSTEVTPYLSLLVGLIGVCITLEIDSSMRLRSHLSSDDQSFTLLTAIEQAPELIPSMTKIIQYAVTSLNAEYPPEFAKGLHHLMNRCERELRALSMGRLTYQSDTDVDAERIEASKRRVQATSLMAVDKDWWTSRAGAEYLDLNQRAVDRGVKIERIFILESEPQREILEALHDQVNHGIITSWVLEADIPASLERNIAIYDDEYLVESVFTSRKEIDSFLISINEDDLDEARESMARLKGIARIFSLTTPRL